METNPEEYASDIHRYAEAYLQKREGLRAVISKQNRRIERVLLFDRCMGGAVLCACLVMIYGIVAGSRVVGIFSSLAIICMSLAPMVVGVQQMLDAAFAKRRELEHDLEIIDQAWRHWSTS